MNNDKIHLTIRDLNTEVSIAEWVKHNFPEINISEIEPSDLASALEGILHDKNFVTLSDEKKNRFIPLLNNLKDKLNKVKKLV